MYIKQIDTNIYRASRPESQEDMDKIKAMGIKTVINLETGILASLLNQNEGRWEIKDGLNYLHYPLSPILPPEEIDYEMLEDIFEFKEGPILFHCKDGVDRTGLVAAMYRVKFQNWSYNDAIKELKEMGFHNWRYFWWLWTFKKRLGV